MDVTHNRTEWPTHAAAPNTHNRVLEIVERLFPVGETRPALDVPCGAGAFSVRLAELGYDVSSVDIVKVGGFRFEESRLTLADLNRGLPFADKSFDLLVSIEGIEHLENPSFFLRECARVTRDGGAVVITTPNVDSFRARRKCLVDGFFTFFNADDEMTKTSGHLHPIDMVFFRGAAARAGLEVVEVAVNEIPDGRFARWAKNLVRPYLTKKLPTVMRGEVPFFGNVIIYVLRKAPLASPGL